MVTSFAAVAGGPPTLSGADPARRHLDGAGGRLQGGHVEAANAGRGTTPQDHTADVVPARYLSDAVVPDGCPIPPAPPTAGPPASEGGFGRRASQGALQERSAPTSTSRQAPGASATPTASPRRKQTIVDPGPRVEAPGPPDGGPVRPGRRDLTGAMLFFHRVRRRPVRRQLW